MESPFCIPKGSRRAVTSFLSNPSTEKSRDFPLQIPKKTAPSFYTSTCWGMDSACVRPWCGGHNPLDDFFRVPILNSGSFEINADSVTSSCEASAGILYTNYALRERQNQLRMKFLRSNPLSRAHLLMPIRSHATPLTSSCSCCSCVWASASNIREPTPKFEQEEKMSMKGLAIVALLAGC